MTTAGYVLAGGASSRMGTNKALLRVGGRLMLEIVAEAVREATGSVCIVGRPDVYRDIPYRVIADRRTAAGPLAGVETALSDSAADWNLVVACDMPGVSGQGLSAILEEAAGHPEAGCVLPESREGFVEPLCAAYHRRILPAISAALDAGIRKMTDALPLNAVHHMRMTGESIFQNINTPEEWGDLKRTLAS